LRAPALSVVLLAGCFSPQGDPLSFETLPFENGYTQFPDIVLRPFSYPELLCPDGEPSVFYAVYREGLTEPAPIVLFLHAGAFDYVKNPDPEEPLAGPHYRDDSRFTAEWAGNKVFETFGELPGESLDPSEINEGTLPAALADAGAFTLYPANCWGDLWHNEDFYSANDWDADGGIHRQGRFLAWWMTRIASSDAAEATEWRASYGLDTLTVPLDASGIYVVGLGEGGRGAAELLRRTRDAADANMPPIKGMILDSTMDKLYSVFANTTAYGAFDTGLERIFPDFATSTEGDIGRYSLDRWIGDFGLTQSLQVVWSSEDPQVPDETLFDLINRQSAYPTLMTVEDKGTAEHVFLNNDAQAARRAVDRLLGD
jgi:hypothetical protein